VSCPRLSAGRTQHLRHLRIDLGEQLLALRVANPGRQFFQAGDEALRRGLRYCMFNPEPGASLRMRSSSGMLGLVFMLR
jgi:hypothetical protein